MLSHFFCKGIFLVFKSVSRIDLIFVILRRTRAVIAMFRARLVIFRRRVDGSNRPLRLFIAILEDRETRRRKIEI